ncbi:MAG: hypothetical protein AAB681_01130 [Patescibacteria group bacterium]
MRNTEAALRWIVTILEKMHIPFEIDGGFAAKMYGEDRELADIDINIPLNDFHRLIPFVTEYIIYGPKQYKDDNWDLLMTSIKYSGQTIDISALGKTKYFNQKEQKWVDFPEDLSEVRIMDYKGIKIPVINEVKLMIYKTELGRGVDKKDVKGMIGSLFK